MFLAINQIDGLISVMMIIPQTVETKIKDADGSESIGYAEVMPDVSEEIEKWKSSNQGLYVSHAEIDPATIPGDKYFRKAWVYDSGKVSIDIPKARAVHLENIRLIRNKKLAELDVEFIRGNDVENQKQILRDMPQTIAADLAKAKTPDKIKAVWPQGLDR